MYTTCLFCHGDLGRNEVVEAFPVGRRLAFDAAKGRLWVVCRRCERWNLTPLEERWEAIEDCERLYRGVRTRIATDNIGLARLAEGLELVRIGRPLRPEMAAWRYGDQFGRRRKRAALAIGGAAAVTVGTVVGVPVVASALGIGMFLPIMVAQHVLSNLWTREDDPKHALIARLGNGHEIAVSRKDLGLAQLLVDGDDTRLLVVSSARTRLLLGDRVKSMRRETLELRGDDAQRVLGALLPRANRLSGGSHDVRRAVQALEAAPSVERLLHAAAAEAQRHYDTRPVLQLYEQGALATIPAPLRLALEMAAHEEQERRALEGELAQLERAWQAAEEVAGIADGLLVPEAVAGAMTRLKGQSGDTSGGPPP